VLENNGTLRSYTTNVPTLVIPASDLTAGPSVVRVTATSTGDCVGSSGDAFQFTVVANPQPGISTPDVPLCSGNEPAPFEITLFGQDYPAASVAFVWTHNNNNVPVGTGPTHTVVIDDPNKDPDYGAYRLTVSRTFPEYSNLVCTATSNVYWINKPNCELPVLTPPVYFLEWHFEECGTVRVIGLVEVENWEEQVEDAEWVVEDFTGTIQDNPRPIENYEGLNTTLSVFSKPGFYPTWLRVLFTDSDHYSSDRKVIEIPAVPNFKWDAACGSDPDTYNVDFTDLTETIPGGAGISKWTWSIDGVEQYSSETLPNFSHLFTRGQSAQSYEVCLTVFSATAFYQAGTSYTCEICRIITIPGKPDISISPQEANVCKSTPIQFNATYNANDILDLTWDFGDGTGSKVAHPIKVFDVAGAHTVTTTFKDIYGCSFTDQVIVHVNENTLGGSIVATSGDCNSMVWLEFQSAPAGVTYSWNYPNAVTSKILVEQSGIYNVTVTDPQTGCMYSPKPVEVVLQSPFISGILGPRRICRGANLELSVTPVSGYTYKWTNSITTGVTTGPKMTIPAASIPNNVNSITVTVTAMQNGHDCSVRSVVVHIDPVPNEPGISYNYACPPYPITLSAQNTANTPPTPLNAYWASTTNGAINPLGFGPQVNIFSSGVVRAIVTNEFGCEKYKEVSLAGTPKIEMLTGCYALCEEDFVANNYVLRATFTGGPIVGYEWFVGGTSLDRVNGVDIPFASLTLAAHHAGKKIFLRVYKRFNNSNGSQQECSFDSDVFCFELKTCVSCTPPPSQVHNIICIQNDPAKKQYYVKWTHTPVDGIVRPCAVNAADLIIRNSSNDAIGRFVLLTYEAAGLNWDFEGTIVLDDGNEYSYQNACWDIPFCLVSNGLPCGVSKVCTNPNTPFAPCVDPHCPPEKFKWDVGVRCGESNGAAYHVDLSLSYEDIPVASTGCNAYDVLITSRSGNMNNGISLKGIHADANGDLVLNPTLFPPLSFDWFEGPGGIGTDIICLEVRIRYHDLCWPEPNPTLICKQYFCVDPSKLNCVPSDLPPAYSFSASCIQGSDANGYEYKYVVDFLNETDITKCKVANNNPNGTNTISSFGGKRVSGHYISQNGSPDFEDIFTINGQNIYPVKAQLPPCTPGIGGEGPGAGDGGRESMPLLKSTVEGSLQLMPNPTSGHIMFNYAFPIESIEASRGLVIANALGVAVQQFDLSHMSSSGVINYEVSNLPTGVYQVYLLDQKQVVSIKKMVVLKN